MNEKGEKIAPDFSLLAGIKYVELKQKLSKAAISIDSSLSIVKYLEKINCEIITTPVGEGSVLNKILSEKCDLGGEGSSGGFIYPDFNLCRDGILLALMTSYLVEKFGSVDNIFADIEKFNQSRIKIITDPSNFSIIQTNFLKNKNVISTDGIKINQTENSWVLIRPSNTEKCIRISAEAKSKNEVDKLINKYEQTIKKILN